MAITVSGISSGLDIESLVTQLMALEQAPLTALAKKESAAETKISALGSLKSVLSSLQTAAQAFVPGTSQTASEKLSSFSASIADTSIATVSSSSKAVAGTYTLEVTQLAQAHQIVSSTAAFSPPDTDGVTRLATGGTLTIALGTASDADATKTTSIEIADGASIETIRDKINAASAGVAAVIVNGSAGKQLVLTGNTTGDDQIITLSGIDGLSYDGSGSGVDEFTQAQAAQGSAFKLNGIAVTASTNTVTTAVDGLTLNLAKVSETDVATTITVSRSTSSLTSAVNAFVKAFNGFSSTASSLGSYNATTETAGTLNGDSTLRSTQNRMRSLLTSVPSGLSGATYQLLSNIGVSLQKDGTLAVDSTKLSDAVSKDFTGVANLLSAVGTAFDDAIDSLTGSDGIIAARTDGLNATIKRYEKQYESIEARLEKIEARYRTQFTSLETLISSMNSTSTYLTQQLENLSNLNSQN